MFNDVHDLTVLMGTSLYQTKGRFYGVQGITQLGTNNPSQTTSTIDTTIDNEFVNPRFNPQDIENGNDIFDTRLSSFFTRVQYNYKVQFYLTGYQ